MPSSDQSIFDGITAPESNRVVSRHTLEDFTTALANNTVVVVELFTGLRIELVKKVDQTENPEIEFDKQSATFRATPKTSIIDFTAHSITRSLSGGVHIKGTYPELYEQGTQSFERLVPITFYLLTDDGESITYSQE
jgi:hypothetical protein